MLGRFATLENFGDSQARRLFFFGGSQARRLFLCNTLLRPARRVVKGSKIRADFCDHSAVTGQKKAPAGGAKGLPGTAAPRVGLGR